MAEPLRRRWMWYATPEDLLAEFLSSPRQTVAVCSRAVRAETRLGYIRSNEAAFWHSASNATQTFDSLGCVRAKFNDSVRFGAVRGSAFDRVFRRVLSERGEGGRLGAIVAVSHDRPARHHPPRIFQISNLRSASATPKCQVVTLFTRRPSRSTEGP